MLPVATDASSVVCLSLCQSVLLSLRFTLCDTDVVISPSCMWRCCRVTLPSCRHAADVCVVCRQMSQTDGVQVRAGRRTNDAAWRATVPENWGDTPALFLSCLNATVLLFLFLSVFIRSFVCLHLPSVLWRCWLGGRKGIQPVKTEWWGTGVVICLEQSANDLHMVQLIPLPPHHLLLQ